jgi:thioredoxin 1
MMNLTERDFQSEVLNSEGVVLVDFWAPWCGPCRMVAPVLEQLGQEYGNSLKIGKVNIDENPGIAAQYGVMSIPTMIVFKDGRKVEQFVGAMPKPALKSKLEKWVGGWRQGGSSY